MPQDTSFVELMTRLRAGSDEAAAEIFERFAGRLIALARSRMDPQMRQKVDPEDVIQSVYQSFFERQARGEFDLHSWDSLWGLLAIITLRKCGHHVEHYHSARRDIRREVSVLGSKDELAGDLEAIAREPTPQEAAVLTETLEHVMRELEGYQRHILQLSLQGNSVAEISPQVGYSQRTVQRILLRVRSTLERLRSGALGP